MYAIVPYHYLLLTSSCHDATGDIVMKMRQAAATMHHREKLMNMAFEGIGGLPMATIDRFRDAKVCARNVGVWHFSDQSVWAAYPVVCTSRAYAYNTCMC